MVRMACESLLLSIVLLLEADAKISFVRHRVINIEHLLRNGFLKDQFIEIRKVGGSSVRTECDTVCNVLKNKSTNPLYGEKH